MSRETHQQVLDLADQILLRGERPTQQRIRAELGRGSLTTINKALAEWWSTLGPRLHRSTSIPDLPPELVSGMQQLWEQALRCASREQADLLVVANEQIKRTRQALHETEADKINERTRLSAQLQAALEASTSQLQLIEDQRHEIAELTQQLSEMQGRLNAQDREIKALESTLRRLGS